MGENTIPDVASRIAQRALAKRGANYANEVRRLLDAALETMRQRGTASRPRVADIVTAAGLSNEAFYRHFPSKDALVAALLEDGTDRLCGYVAHQMTKETTAPGMVRRWVVAVVSQATGGVGAATRAVLWNLSGLPEGLAAAPPSVSAKLAELLRGPFAELGCPDPGFATSLAAHAIVGKLSDYLWHRVEPTADDIDRITAFCLRTAIVH